MEDAYRWKIITLEEGKRLLVEAHRRLAVAEVHLCELRDIPARWSNTPPIPMCLSDLSIELSKIAEAYYETAKAIRDIESALRDSGEEYYSDRILNTVEEMGIDFYATQSERVFPKRD